MAPDVLVIGGGIFGLSVARSLRRAGLAVRVLEGARVGAGASGGIVGALTPHAPTRWRDMMAFQFQALVALPDRIAEIEAATDQATGYARTGRLTPLPDPERRARAEREAAAAPALWGKAAAMRVLDRIPEAAAGWITPEAAACGLLHDTLSARIDPRRYIAALRADLGTAIEEGVTVERIDSGATLQTSAGQIAAGHVVIAAGSNAWALAAPFTTDLRGSAVKGQAALLVAEARALPLIYQDGLYIVAHGEGRVAVGSTSEKTWTDPAGTDEHLDALIARARALCPALAHAPVIERWSGLRPKPPRREPVAGPLPGHPRLWIAGGGYKIGFGIAHLIGDALTAMIIGKPPATPLPESFLPQ